MPMFFVETNKGTFCAEYETSLLSERTFWSTCYQLGYSLYGGPLYLLDHSEHGLIKVYDYIDGMEHESSSIELTYPVRDIWRLTKMPEAYWSVPFISPFVMDSIFRYAPSIHLA